MLEFDVLTLFPEMVAGPLSLSIAGRAEHAGLFAVRARQLRDWAFDKHRRTDDYLCGGGQGMLMKCEPIFAAVEELRRPDTCVILMTPQGRAYNQAAARALAARGGHYIIICGHYEGVDQRVTDALVDMELSIGDFILTNGAIAAVTVIDSIVRLLPGALGNERSPQEESFGDGLLEAPAYTKPNEFRGMKVPEVLLSGNHAAIAEWKRAQSLERTRRNRPDLYEAWLKKNRPAGNPPAAAPARDAETGGTPSADGQGGR